ncbi:hypothetical protein [Micromonospora fluostatini]|uniref:hypothetical protein n=1 Tax=Micromonospora sp. JCM 30529 TaxID=3421643 RepID=UPI003D17B261
MPAVRDVVRDVVAKVAPQELPLVDGLAAYDDDTVIRRLGRAGPRREPLGFGWGEVVGLLTPVVWLVLDQVAQRLTGAAVDEATDRGRGLLRRLVRARRAPATIPPLTADQLPEVRQEVCDLLVRRGVAAPTATEIADAVLRRLDPDPDAPRPAP